MRVPAPPDPVLGARAATLVDAAAVALLLQEQLGEPVTRCRPCYARYKPRASLLVQYELELAESGATLAHAWLYADARAERVWGSRSFRLLLERTRRRHPGPPARRAAFVPALRALVELSPVDSRLPALVRAASPKKLRRLLAAEAGAVLDGSPAELVRHKPGRKALLRYAGADGAIYVKLHAEGGGAGRLALARTFVAAGIPTAPPLAHVAELEAVVYAEVRGTRLADLRAAPTYAEALEAAADALAALHRGARPPSADGGAESTRVLQAGRAVGALVPRLERDATALAAAIARRLRAADERVVLAHGDFYDDQLLVSPDGVVVIDLDEARAAHPLVDVGTFLAHLTVQTPQDDDLRARFLDACAAAEIDVRGALAFEAAALLGLAVAPFRRLDPDWPEGVEATVGLAASRLAEHDRESSAHRDPSLPQLRSLCDERIAGRVLTRALGRPVAVSSVAVVRHKAGRRCTLRYALSDGSRVFGKTYATHRARRVYESTRLLAAAGAPVPAALGWDERDDLIVLAPLAGAPVARRVAAGDEEIGVAAAQLLHRLHTCGVSLARRHELADELSPLQDRVERLSAAAPFAAAPARRCLSLAGAGAELPWQWRSFPSHRDFYEDQLVLGPGGLVVLDADDAAMSEPALDVANFSAHLRLLGMRRDVDAAGPAAVRRAFLRRYSAFDPGLDRRLVVFLEGTTLLRLAEIHLERAGANFAERVLASSERLLCATIGRV